jgi:hypothetical protein
VEGDRKRPFPHPHRLGKGNHALAWRGGLETVKGRRVEGGGVTQHVVVDEGVVVPNGHDEALEGKRLHPPQGEGEGDDVGPLRVKLLRGGSVKW